MHKGSVLCVLSVGANGNKKYDRNQYLYNTFVLHKLIFDSDVKNQIRKNHKCRNEYGNNGNQICFFMRVTCSDINIRNQPSYRSCPHADNERQIFRQKHRKRCRNTDRHMCMSEHIENSPFFSIFLIYYHFFDIQSIFLWHKIR